MICSSIFIPILWSKPIFCTFKKNWPKLIIFKCHTFLTTFYINHEDRSNRGGHIGFKLLSSFRMTKQQIIPKHSLTYIFLTRPLTIGKKHRLIEHMKTQELQNSSKFYQSFSSMRIDIVIPMPTIYEPPNLP